MNTNDMIMVNVSGVNGSTRNTKSISRSFNGLGELIDDNGQVVQGAAERLRNLPTGAVAEAPAWPAAEFEAARKLGAAGAEKIRKIQVEYSQLYTAWEKSIGGGNAKQSIARSVLEYAKEFHNFREKDEGEFFVLKPDDLAVVETKLKEDRVLYTVTGTAVFGKAAA